MKKFLIIIVALFGLSLLCAVAAFGGLLYWAQKPSAFDDKTVVQIDAGSGFEEIAEILYSHKVISHPLPFKAYAYLTRDYARVKAGEYAFPAKASPQQVLQQMVEGKSITHAITFPEGLTSQQILTLLAQDPRLKGDLPETISEGSLMPDTYHFHRNDSRASVLQRMQEEANKRLPVIWAKRDTSLPLSSPEELLVLASIVEKETGVGAERAKVAGVFYNRLKIGMPLQSDPTVVYGIEKAKGMPMGRALTKRDLETNHPYNTYIHQGLPPEPICNVGTAALEAAALPESTDALYFVATGEGGHRFASSLSEHNQNVRLYRAALRRASQAAE